MNVNAGKLHCEYLEAGLPLHIGGIDGEGVAHWDRPLTQDEETTAAAVLAAHNPNALTAGEKRAIAAKYTFQELAGTNIMDINNVPELRAIVRALLQLEGYADENGVILPPGGV